MYCIQDQATNVLYALLICQLFSWKTILCNFKKCNFQNTQLYQRVKYIKIIVHIKTVDTIIEMQLSQPNLWHESALHCSTRLSEDPSLVGHLLHLLQFHFITGNVLGIAYYIRRSNCTLHAYNSIFFILQSCQIPENTPSKNNCYGPCISACLSVFEKLLHTSAVLWLLENIHVTTSELTCILLSELIEYPPLSEVRSHQS